MIILFINGTSVVLQAVFTICNAQTKVIGVTVTSDICYIPLLRTLRLLPPKVKCDSTAVSPGYLATPYNTCYFSYPQVHLIRHPFIFPLLINCKDICLLIS